MDQFATLRGDIRLRPTSTDRRASVVTVAATEVLRPVPPIPYPAVLTESRQVSRQALVAYRGNRYSVPPELVAGTVTVSRRVGAEYLDIVTQVTGPTSWSPDTGSQPTAPGSMSATTATWSLSTHRALQTAGEHGYLLLVMDTDDDRDAERRQLETLRDRQVDGILVVAPELMQYDPPEALIDHPAVLVNCLDPDGTVTSTAPDEVEAGRRATEVLLSHQHERIGLLVGNPKALQMSFKQARQVNRVGVGGHRGDLLQVDFERSSEGSRGGRLQPLGHAGSQRAVHHVSGLNFLDRQLDREREVQDILLDPRVSLAIDGTGAQPHVAQGRAFVRGTGNFPHLVALLTEKYDGWDATDETQDGPRVLLEVPLDRWLLAGG